MRVLSVFRPYFQPDYLDDTEQFEGFDADVRVRLCGCLRVWLCVPVSLCMLFIVISACVAVHACFAVLAVRRQPRTPVPC